MDALKIEQGDWEGVLRALEGQVDAAGILSLDMALQAFGGEVGDRDAGAEAVAASARQALQSVGELSTALRQSGLF